MPSSNGDNFATTRVPTAASEREQEYRRGQKVKAAYFMVKGKADGHPDLVQMLGLDEVFWKPEHHEGLRRLSAERGGEGR